MRTVAKGLFKSIWQPNLQFVRNRTKVNVTRPRPPHFDRALLESVCQPVFNKKWRPPHIPDFEACSVQPKKATIDWDHPYLNILAKECLDFFTKSRMVAFFHFNAINHEEKFQCELELKKIGLKLKLMSRIVSEKALKGTMYETVNKLFCAPTMAAFGPEADISKLLKVVKKLPKFVLMACIVDDKLLSLSELKTYSTLKDITDARLMLMSTLNSVSQNLLHQVNHHPSNFVGLLNQQKKILEGS